MPDTPTRPAPGDHRRPGPWFPGLPGAATAARQDGTVPLICLPYAGGTPSVFHGWQQRLGTRATVVPVLLPGRGLRLREAPYSALAPLVHDLADALQKHVLTRHGYALFGHSMGALVAYETALELRRRGAGEPLHLVVSGSRAPQLYGDRRDHLLPDEELRAVIGGLGGLGAGGGTADAYFRRRLPALRADLRACEQYRARPRAPLRCPVTAVSATDDPIATAAQVDAWHTCCAGPFTRLHLPGDHFFLHGPSSARLLHLMREVCDRLRPHPTQPSGRTPR
ncbi:thioesterase II family protein [Streptomyces albus]|uniref:thioesterase II family protein n=1 Tax=Streptomyces sp. PHES57 TaxID=2872626 RepID=UPI001CED6E63|nr:alpha/beta fold hydrolase [Streptomyces sp. PHES57]